MLSQSSAISRAGVYDIVATENAKAAEVGSAGDCFSIKAAKAAQIIEAMITAMRGEKASTRWKTDLGTRSLLK